MIYKQDYFGFVYIWMDTKRYKFCIGSHYGSKDDSYISSTGILKSVYKRRPETFKRRILFFLLQDDKKLLLEAEQKWLNKIKDVDLGKKYYNFKKFAAGGSIKGHKKNRIKPPWNKGVSREMLRLRRNGDFCLLIDKPKESYKNTKKLSEKHRKILSEYNKKKWRNWRISKNLDPDSKYCERLREIKLVCKDTPKIIKEKKPRVAWNKGLKNPTAADNGRRGANKQSMTVTGRRKIKMDDGSYRWVYPNNDASD